MLDITVSPSCFLNSINCKICKKIDYLSTRFFFFMESLLTYSMYVVCSVNIMHTLSAVWVFLSHRHDAQRSYKCPTVSRQRTRRKTSIWKTVPGAAWFLFLSALNFFLYHTYFISNTTPNADLSKSLQLYYGAFLFHLQQVTQRCIWYETCFRAPSCALKLPKQISCCCLWTLFSEHMRQGFPSMETWD